MKNTRKTAGMRSLAVGFPSIRRTNDYWRVHHPDMVARAEQYSLAKIWAAPAEGQPRTLFDDTMDPFVRDPFRGAKERRIRARGETALSMELTAARGALEAAELPCEQIDLMLVASFMADRLGVGNATYLSAELGLRAPSLNFETACSGSAVGLKLASELVCSGEYERVLVVASTSNSRQVAPDDNIAWFVGDGAGAFVVQAMPPGLGVLGSFVIPSIQTNDMFVIRPVPEDEGEPKFVTRASPRTAAVARETAEPYLRAAVGGALASAGLEASDVDFWVFNTPTAWYAEFCGRTLGVPEDRWHSCYDRYANIGAALMPSTLYHALHEGKIRPGDVVGIYSIGSSSSTGCVIMRVGNIALGPYPEAPEQPDADRPTDGPERIEVDEVRQEVESPAVEPLRHGVASTREVVALAAEIWGADVPAAVRQAISDPKGLGEGACSAAWTRHHDIEVEPGITVRVTERASLRCLLASPRRGVLLLPGPISRASSWDVDVDGYRLQSDLAAAGMFAFAVDYAGVEGSSQPTPGGALGHDRCVAHMRLVVATLRASRWLPPMDVVGESIGGAVAAELADDETNVRSCVMSVMLYRKGSSAFEDTFLDPKFVEHLRTTPGGYLDATADYYGNIVSGSPPAVSQAIFDTQPGRYAIAPLLEPLRMPWFDPTRARVPGLVVHGEHDTTPAPGDAQALAEAYGGMGGGRARTEIIQGAGHIPRLDSQTAAARFREILLDFLEAR